MGVLLLLVGVLAVASGTFKLRPRVRSLVGTSPLAIAELVVGAVVVAGSGVGLARVRPLAWILVAVALALIVASSVTLVRAALVSRRSREASAEARLQIYLESRAREERTGEES